MGDRLVRLAAIGGECDWSMAPSPELGRQGVRRPGRLSRSCHRAPGRGPLLRTGRRPRSAFDQEALRRRSELRSGSPCNRKKSGEDGVAPGSDGLAQNRRSLSGRFDPLCCARRAFVDASDDHRRVAVVREQGASRRPDRRLFSRAAIWDARVHPAGPALAAQNRSERSQHLKAGHPDRIRARSGTRRMACTRQGLTSPAASPSRKRSARIASGPDTSPLPCSSRGSGAWWRCRCPG